MTMNRTLKKFLYGLFYLVCVALLGLLVSRLMFSAPATCFDNIQNQRETGVDCGGPCVICEIKNLTPLQTLQPYRILGLSNGRATLLFGVENQNSTYHAMSFAYHIDIFDKGGTKIEQYDGTDSLYANERKYLVEPRIGARAGNIGSVAVTLRDPEWRSAAEVTAPALSLSGITTEIISPGNIRVNGTASNKGGTSARDVKIVAVAYDKYGSKMFASQSVLTSLSGFQNASFTVPFPADGIFENIDAGKTEVFISGR